MQGVFVLRTPASQAYLTGAETRDRVHKLLTDAQKQCGAACERVTIFENLQSFALDATREVVQAVLASPAIDSAMANVQPESLQIEPIRPKPSKSTPRRGTAKTTSPQATRKTSKPLSRRSSKKPPSSGR